MKKVNAFNKQFLRAKVSRVASYTEIYVSILILFGIILLSGTILQDIYHIGQSYFGSYAQEQTTMISIDKFLAHALELIIGIEFIKMLAKHTPGSTIDVLLFAIARKLIVEHGSMTDSLIGVIAITLLFVVRKYFANLGTFFSTNQDIIVNGGTSIREINEQYGLRIDEKHGFTVAGVISNLAIEKEHALQSGLEIPVDDFIFQVYSMDQELIKQVKIIKAS